MEDRHLQEVLRPDGSFKDQAGDTKSCLSQQRCVRFPGDVGGSPAVCVDSILLSAGLPRAGLLATCVQWHICHVVGGGCVSPPFRVSLCLAASIEDVICLHRVVLAPEVGEPGIVGPLDVVQVVVLAAPACKSAHAVDEDAKYDQEDQQGGAAGHHGVLGHRHVVVDGRLQGGVGHLGGGDGAATCLLLVVDVVDDVIVVVLLSLVGYDLLPLLDCVVANIVANV